MLTPRQRSCVNRRRRMKRYIARLERALDKIANVLEDCESMHGPIERDGYFGQIETILVRTWGSTHKPPPQPPPICPTCGDEGCMQ